MSTVLFIQLVLLIAFWQHGPSLAARLAKAVFCLKNYWATWKRQVKSYMNHATDIPMRDAVLRALCHPQDWDHRPFHLSSHDADVLIHTSKLTIDLAHGHVATKDPKEFFATGSVLDTYPIQCPHCIRIIHKAALKVRDLKITARKAAYANQMETQLQRMADAQHGVTTTPIP